jgi:hypothetical protein
MPRKSESPNISYYHYRADITTDEGEVLTKYFYTLGDMCREFKTSTFTIYRIMKKGYVPTNEALHNIKFYKDYKPAFKMIKNDSIYGELDEII